MLLTSQNLPDDAEATRIAVSTVVHVLSIPAVKQGLLHIALGEPTGIIPDLYRPAIEMLGGILRSAMEQKYETEKHVARRLNVSVKTLQNARWKGTGPKYCHPLGFGSRAVRYNTLKLELWLLQHAVSSTSEASMLGEKGNG